MRLDVNNILKAPRAPHHSASEIAYIVILFEAVRAKQGAHCAQATLTAERVLFTAADLAARCVRLETKRARHGAAARAARCRLWVALTRLVVNESTSASEQLTVR